MTIKSLTTVAKTSVRLRDEIAVYGDEIAVYEDEIAVYGDEIAVYEDEIAVYRDEIAVYGDEIAVYGDEIAVYRDEIAVYGDEIAVYEDEIAVYGDEIAVYEDEIAVYRDEIAVYGDEIAVYGDEIAVYGDEIAVYRDEIAVYGDEIAVYGDEIAVYEDEIAVYRDEIAVYEDEIAVYEDEIAVYGDEIAVYEDEIAVYGDEIAVYEDEIAVYGDEIAVYRDEIAVYRDEIAVAEMISPSNKENSFVYERERKRGLVRCTEPKESTLQNPLQLSSSQGLRKIVISGIHIVDSAEEDKNQSYTKNEDRRPQILYLLDEKLNEEQKLINTECLEEYSEVFYIEEKLFSKIYVKHKIDTSDSRPIKHRPYRVSPDERRAIQSEVDKMIKMEILQQSESLWSSPVVLVKKKDRSWRFYVGYQKLK
ncbi:hypothetical protein LAZ67_15000297 [Cordylochernes scorpioides]|uniref:Reverse transcriptase n=1 Tax=Cordylochernes scorpioides TaxID=51811 RepID=A0ABY6L931_9ARAC|nr:hypothetical protein LAZ67_15000297 [Cordylochernes scorpioides]